MNLNLLSYALFFPAMVYIAYRVAWLCHRNGAIWLMRIFDDERFVRAVNDILLVGCWTVNIGYVALVVSTWDAIVSVPQMLGVLSERIALILFTLAGLHYMNITVLFIWSRIARRARDLAPHQPRKGDACIAPTDNL